MYEKVFAYLDAHAEDYAAQLCRWEIGRAHV